MTELELLIQQQKEIKKRIADLKRDELQLVRLEKVDPTNLRDGFYRLSILTKHEDEWNPRRIRLLSVCSAKDRQYMKDRIYDLVKELSRVYQELEA